MRIRNYETGPFTAQRVRGGAGEVGMLDVLDRSDFETSFAFIKAGRLGPGVSVGLHRHERSEECLLVLDGPLTVAHNEHLRSRQATLDRAVPGRRRPRYPQSHQPLGQLHRDRCGSAGWTVRRGAAGR